MGVAKAFDSVIGELWTDFKVWHASFRPTPAYWPTVLFGGFLLILAVGIWFKPKVIAHPIPSIETPFVTPVEPLQTPLVEQTPVTPIPVIKSSCGSGTYVRGQCTYGVAVWTCVPAGMGNAKYWDDYARSHGYEVSKTPVKGMVAQSDIGWAGHVGLVLDTREGEFLLRDMNWSGPWSVRESWQPIGEWDFIRF